MFLEGLAMSTVMEYTTGREMGLPSRHSLSDRLALTLYSNFKKRYVLNDAPSVPTAAINNMEFSADGRILVAVTANRRVNIYDPVSQRSVTCTYQAHNSAVNAVRFINDYTFMTCGDDSYIYIWDVRKPGHSVLSLSSHNGWVKSIEYYKSQNAVISSSLDGSLIEWNLEGYPDMLSYNRHLMSMPGLVRAALSPDGDKLALTTTGGFILLVHNLNLASLPLLMARFLPVLYRAMHHSKTPMPLMMKFNHLFEKDRLVNRLEFIDDWGPFNNAQVVTCAQFHPQGHFLMSRNINLASSIEYTSVHDVQGNGYWYPKKASHLSQIKRSNYRNSIRPNGQWDYTRRRGSEDEEPTVLLDVLQSLTHIRDIRAINCAHRRRYTIHSSGIEPPENLIFPNRPVTVSVLDEPDTKADTYKACGPIPPELYNHKRLIYFRKEKMITAHNTTVRENSWSHDGRIIAAPSVKGIRLYHFDRESIDLPYTADDIPLPSERSVLKELEIVNAEPESHADHVVCTRFRPHHMQLASGCHQGRIVWHEPTF